MVIAGLIRVDFDGGIGYIRLFLGESVGLIPHREVGTASENNSFLLFEC
jgi:hypothetical protein